MGTTLTYSPAKQKTAHTTNSSCAQPCYLIVKDVIVVAIVVTCCVDMCDGVTRSWQSLHCCYSCCYAALVIVEFLSPFKVEWNGVCYCWYSWQDGGCCCGSKISFIPYIFQLVSKRKNREVYKQFNSQTVTQITLVVKQGWKYSVIVNKEFAWTIPHSCLYYSTQSALTILLISSWSKHLWAKATTLLQIFCKFILNSILIFKCSICPEKHWYEYIQAWVR